MKRLLFTALLSFLVMGATAQKKVLKNAEKAYKKGELQEATSLANQAAENSETQNEPSVYSLLGKISLQQFVASDFSDYDAAGKSLELFNKAIDLSDEKGVEKIKEAPIFNPADLTKWFGGGDELGLLEHYLVTESNKALDAEEYKKAYNLLMYAYDIAPSVEKAFFVGYGAENSDDEETAMEYYAIVSEYDSAYDNKSYAFQTLIQHYSDKEDFDSALDYVRKAKVAFPEEKNFNNWEVDLLIKAERIDQAIAGLQGLIDAGGASKETYYTLSYLQWNNEELDKAEKTAMEALKLDPNYTDALYVAASAIYNQAADFMTTANTTVDDDAKYKELKEKAAARFKDALPLFERCLAADANDLYYLRPLSTIYDQLGMGDKRDEMLDRIDAIEGGGE